MEGRFCKCCGVFFPKFTARNGIEKVFCSDPCRNRDWYRKKFPTVYVKEKDLPPNPEEWY